MRTAFIVASLLMLQQTSFKETHLNEARVKIAYEHMEASAKKRFSDKKLSMISFSCF
jgi:hypothetical protein